jgi:hypothetical protein
VGLLLNVANKTIRRPRKKMWVSLSTALVGLIIGFQLVACSPVPVDFFPLQRRLALTRDGAGITISWDTLRDIRNPKVRYGLSPKHLDQIADGQSTTYPTSWTYSNHVTLENLEPNTTYYYKVSYSRKQVRSFRTPPANHDPFTFAAFADLGSLGQLSVEDFGEKGILMPPPKTTFDSIRENIDSYDFIWHIGDIAYADNWLDEPSFGGTGPNLDAFNTVLNAYYDEVEPVSSQKPYMVGPGNHDINCGLRKASILTETGQDCQVAHRSFSGYLSHFRMPGILDEMEPTMYYSFDYNSVHFVQINTELEFDVNGEPTEQIEKELNRQAKWLAADLAAVDRAKTPWVVVAGHRPWYVAAKSVCTACQEAFEDIMLEYQVDMALFGHVHNYQRNMPIMKGGIRDPNGLHNPSAPLYILNGAGGQLEGLDRVNSRYQKDYLAKHLDDIYGWGRVTVHNATHLTYEFVASVNGTVLDSATLVKDRQPMTSSSPLERREEETLMTRSDIAIPTPLSTAVLLALDGLSNEHTPSPIEIEP